MIYTAVQLIHVYASMLMFIIALQMIVDNPCRHRKNKFYAFRVGSARAYIKKYTVFDITEKHMSRLHSCFKLETTFIRSDYFPHFSVNFLSLRHQFYRRYLRSYRCVVEHLLKPLRY